MTDKKHRYMCQYPDGNKNVYAVDAEEAEAEAMKKFGTAPDFMARMEEAEGGPDVLGE